jgi:hypothetical protein
MSNKLADLLAKRRLLQDQADERGDGFYMASDFETTIETGTSPRMNSDDIASAWDNMPRRPVAGSSGPKSNRYPLLNERSTPLTTDKVLEGPLSAPSKILSVVRSLEKPMPQTRVLDSSLKESGHASRKPVPVQEHGDDLVNTSTQPMSDDSTEPPITVSGSTNLLSPRTSESTLGTGRSPPLS